MRPLSLLLSITSALLASSYSFLSDVPSLELRQVPCNDSDIWSDWEPNCCGESICPSTGSCTAGEQECTATKTTLSVTWTQTVTTTTTPDTVHTPETIYTSVGTSNLSSSGPGTITSSSTEGHVTTSCSGGSCFSTSLQGSIPPSPTPRVSTTDTSLMGSSMSMEHSTCQNSSSVVTTATPLDTSTHSNPEATGSTSAATGTISKPSTTTNTGLTNSSFTLPSSSSAHHSTTTLTTPMTGSSGAERPLVAIAAAGGVIGSMIIQAFLL